MHRSIYDDDVMGPSSVTLRGPHGPRFASKCVVRKYVIIVGSSVDVSTSQIAHTHWHWFCPTSWDIRLWRHWVMREIAMDDRVDSDLSARVTASVAKGPHANWNSAFKTGQGQETTTSADSLPTHVEMSPAAVVAEIDLPRRWDPVATWILSTCSRNRKIITFVIGCCVRILVVDLLKIEMIGRDWLEWAALCWG